ncbi:MAG: polysaccharide biosynthesis protein, partial [Gemmatimonadales bacterium]|nr:polysaccharide biosynthesis protein [Gemmatimonadales bacterium]
MPTEAPELLRTRFRNRYLFGSDAVLFAASTALAYALRFDGFEWLPAHEHAALVFLAVSLPLKLYLFWRFGLYARLWRHAGVVELERLMAASTLSGLICFFIGAFILSAAGLIPIRVPFSVLFMDALLTAASAVGPRLAVRVWGRRGQRHRLAHASRTLMVGAGAAGETIVKELLAHPNVGLNPIGFVDDDRSKHGHRMCDLPVLGSLSAIKDIILTHEIDEVVIAMPNAPGRTVREVVRVAMEAGVKTRTIPGMSDILTGRVAVGQLRQVEIQDLLRRDPIQTDLEEVRALATGETVLVTGAGGSIGSELCRQLARLDPAEVVLLGHGENSIFEVLQELGATYPTVTFVPVIADV